MSCIGVCRDQCHQGVVRIKAVCVQDFLLTDFNLDIRQDASVRSLQADTTVHALFSKDKQSLLPTKVCSWVAQPCIRWRQDQQKGLLCRNALSLRHTQRPLQWQGTMSTLQHRQVHLPICCITCQHCLQSVLQCLPQPAWLLQNSSFDTMAFVLLVAHIAAQHFEHFLSVCFPCAVLCQ